MRGGERSPEQPHPPPAARLATALSYSRPPLPLLFFPLLKPGLGPAAAGVNMALGFIRRRINPWPVARQSSSLLHRQRWLPCPLAKGAGGPPQWGGDEGWEGGYSPRVTRKAGLRGPWGALQVTPAPQAQVLRPTLICLPQPPGGDQQGQEHRALQAPRAAGRALLPVSGPSPPGPAHSSHDRPGGLHLVRPRLYDEGARPAPTRGWRGRQG